MILDSIIFPSDLKKLSISELEKLCSELRSEIIRITAKQGGHLGSNLGAIELIVAIHYVFDCPNDKLLLDVGHQSYAHKLLTNRRELMENLRSKGGASGFLDPNESEYDYFISGHASTSLSAAIGAAKARDLNRKKSNIISVLGDGALSGGMIYEALNNVAGIKDFIVILNDNQMSISESVGSMKQYLSRLLASKKGLSLRKNTGKILNKIPLKFSKSLEKFIKNSVCAFHGGTIFEEFGLQYIGPIDGHNLKDLISTFKNIKEVANYKPVIIHTLTTKGKGHALAEKDATRMHGVEKKIKNTYTDVFENKIAELASTDEKIVCITAAMKSGCGFTKFASMFPDRFFDVGIAEAHAVTFAAGLAKEGFKPYVAIYSTFLQRAFDQIYHDVVLQNLPVRFIIGKAGVPGPDGKTHSGIYDVAMLQNFPNFVIMAPSSKQELEYMLEFSTCDDTSPMAIRFPKAEAFDFPSNSNFSDKSNIILEGEKSLIISTGNLLKTVLEAISISKTNPTVIDARFTMPFDFNLFYELAKSHEKIIILEEGVFGGISNVILEDLLKNNITDILSKLKFINVSKNPIYHSEREEQLNYCKLSANDISNLLL